jgi:hypothetical protein
MHYAAAIFDATPLRHAITPAAFADIRSSPLSLPHFRHYAFAASHFRHCRYADTPAFAIDAISPRHAAADTLRIIISMLSLIAIRRALVSMTPLASARSLPAQLMPPRFTPPLLR